MKQIDDCFIRINPYPRIPYSVNVITFSGHGYHIDGDAIAIIPEVDKETQMNGQLRFINMSGIARKFASKKYSLNIFLLSMCRVFFPESKLQNLDEGPFKNLKEDALNVKNKTAGFN